MILSAGQLLAALNATVGTGEEPDGLCGDRGEHRAHLVTEGSLAPFWCTADQAQREPGVRSAGRMPCRTTSVGRRGRTDGRPARDAASVSTGNRGKTWRYPDRKRCLACRAYFGFTVLDGLYCSARCARVPQVSADPADWPREHFSRVPHSDRRKAKKGYLDRRAAISAARRLRKQAYLCGYCLEYHVGSPDPAKTYPPNRVITI